MRTKDLELKYEALKWLRLKQRCAFIATEVGAHSADCLGINEKKMIEVEVKINEEDIHREFRDKMHKHNMYNGNNYGIEWSAQWIPNSFYIATLPELVTPTRKFFDERGWAKYGIITLNDFKVVRQAKRLHDREPNNHVKFLCALRMGSALIRFHEAWV